MERWDVVVVGARCAGAALGAWLARAGVRTLVLEAAPRGTDMAMSTHFMQPPGMAALDRLGVADRVRAVAPEARTFRAALDEAELLAPMPSDCRGYCVRRSTLDPMLQDAAEAAGAELRDRHRVVELLRDGERVQGVVAQTPAGRVRIGASLVVGADGPHSTVARLTEAEEYLVTHGTRGGYWAYFPAPKTWTAPWDATFEHRGEELRYVFRCDGDMIVLVVAQPLAQAQRWGKQYRERLRLALAHSPTTAPLAEGHEPVGKVHGLLQTRYFYRRPIGPGFALVGDAGHFKDFVTGQGMTDALLDAERLSRAIVDGREAAFQWFWRARDVATLPLHFDAIRQGRVGYNEPFMRWMFTHIAQRPDILRRFSSVLNRTLDPDALVPTRALLGFMGTALLRSRFDVLRGFLATGKELSAERKELEARRGLLQKAELELSGAPKPVLLAA